ncbi:MAG: bile acid:sodium symporter family protein [Bacteroidota bacterium]
MESSILTQIFLPLALFIIMLGMGLSLVLNDFRRVVQHPKATLLGLSNQLLLLPLVGFLLAQAFALPGELAVGLMLLAACPGGVTSNLISHLANGDTALSITLTAISSLITIITIPIVVNYSMLHFLAQDEQIAVDVVQMILQIAVITVIPVAIGMYIRSRNEKFARKMERPVKIVSAVFLALIIVAAVIKDRDNLLTSLQLAGPAALALNVTTMGLGYLSARLLRLSTPQSVTVSIESGIQNGTLAIGIALGILENGTISIPPAIYSLLMFATGGAMIAFFGRKRSEEVKFQPPLK